MQVKVTLTLKEEELKKIMDETGITTADGLKGYCIGSNILRNVNYEFGSKWDIGFEVIENEPSVTIPEVKEVKEVSRKAEVGEWIKIVNEPGDPSSKYYSKGDILKVYKIANRFTIHFGGVFCELSMKADTKVVSSLLQDNGNIIIWDHEYVVLEGYEPPKKPEVKEVKRQAKVGEYVKLTYDGLFEGRIYKVREICSKAYKLKDVAYVDIDDDFSLGYTVDEYVVLENYEPEDGEKK